MVSPPSQLLPIWATPLRAYTVGRAFSTDIITSRRGNEQRRALRESPVKTISYKTSFQIGLWRTFNQMMVNGQRTRWFTLDQSRAVKAVVVTTSPLVFNITAVPTWLGPGAEIVIRSGLSIEAHSVSSIVGLQVTLNGSTTLPWTALTFMYPAVQGFLKPTIPSTTNYETWIDVDMTFEVDPTSEFPDPPPIATTFFNGREVFLLKPMRIAPISIDRSQFREDVYAGQGIAERFFPSPFSPRVYRGTYATITHSNQELLRGLFERMNGRRDEFYMPTFENDLPLKTAATSGTNTLVVAGSDTAIAYSGSTLYQAVAVFMPDGSIQLNTLTNITTNGIDTTLTFQSNWAVTVPTNAVVSWLCVWRHATDLMQVDWLIPWDSDDKPFATVQMTYQMLEDISGDGVMQVIQQYAEVITDFE